MHAPDGVISDDISHSTSPDGLNASTAARREAVCARNAACVLQLHDQGAGGNCNVVKEIIYPLGAEIDIRAVKLGDATMSVLEIWGAEYQENDCLLIREADRGQLEAICARERCYMQVPPPF